ncbi:MAG: endonuclease/exonuclease/phosphatase family protein [Planctomycetota bacterium]
MDTPPAIEAPLPARGGGVLRAGALLAVAVGAALTALTASARWFWLGDVACHFRWQLGLGGLAAAVLCGVARMPRLALVAALVAGLHLVPTARLYLPVERVPSEPQLLVGTANLLWDNPEEDAVRRWIRSQRPDVLAALELNPRWLAVLRGLRDEYPHQLFFPENPESWPHDTWGQGLISRLPLEQVRIHQTIERFWPVLEVQLRVGGEPVLLRVVHPPRPGRAWRNAQRDTVLRSVATLPWGRHAVLMGDLNTSAYAPIFGELLRTSGLRDSRAGFGRQATFVAELRKHIPGAPVSLSVPLDHVLVGDGVEVVDRWTSEIPGSDHRGVLARLSLR